MSEEINFNVVTPFTNVVSRGGKFDDDSFYAGFEMGNLDFKLFQMSAIQAESICIVILSDNLHQADIIAMKHGLVLAEKTFNDAGNLCSCRFARTNHVL
jgi:hypothetical protein